MYAIRSYYAPGAHHGALIGGARTTVAPLPSAAHLVYATPNGAQGDGLLAMAPARGRNNFV